MARDVRRHDIFHGHGRRRAAAGAIHTAFLRTAAYDGGFLRVIYGQKVMIGLITMPRGRRK